MLNPALGRVGEVIAVDDHILRTLAEAGYVPVICSVATDDTHQPLNVNADLAASAIASAVDASKLILLTDTDGVLADKHNPESVISRLSRQDAQSMIDTGKADQGMIPKLQSAISALDHGVGTVHMINGGLENALLIEVFTDAGIGTMVS